MKIFGFVNQN